MTIRKFAQQIEYLLQTGALQGDRILSLYYLLKDYSAERISAQVMQEAINQCDPDQLDQLFDEEFPHLFE